MERKAVSPIGPKVFFLVLHSCPHRPHPSSSLSKVKTEDAGGGAAALRNLPEVSVCFNQQELFIKQSSSK